MRHYIIPLFIPHAGCPHTCVFCNQRRITGVATTVTPADIQRILEFHMRQITRPYCVEAAFYGGSFTALPFAVQKQLLQPTAAYLADGRLQAVRLSTRPDCIDEPILTLLRHSGVQTIELGAQSFDDSVLRAAGRGHTAAAIRRAAGLIRAYGFALGIQLMPGLPGDTEQSMMQTLQETLALRPDCVRIYPTLVLRGTRLADLYQAHRFTPLSMETAVSIAAHMKLAFERAGIRVIRTGLQSSPELDAGDTILAGPYHPAFGEMVESCIFAAMVEKVLSGFSGIRGPVVLHHAAKDTSKLRGMKNCNMKRWQAAYPQAVFLCRPDGQAAGCLQIEYQGAWHAVTRESLP